MKKISNKEVKMIQIDILKHVSKFCEDNDIKYFLSGGTLLGAVRHKGYIPWDDDIDIMLLRKDYDKFIKLFNVNSNKYKVFSNDTDKLYPFPFAKVSDLNTLLKENTNIKYPLGINIDVFPLDILPDNEYESIKFYRKVKVLKKIYILKSLKFKKDRTFIKKAIQCFAYIVLKPISVESIVKKICKISIKYNMKDSRYIGCVVWGYGMKERMNKGVFNETIKVEFEGDMYNAPIGYDEYLRSLYGDYMKLPSVEKRQTHHEYEAFLIN